MAGISGQSPAFWELVDRQHGVVERNQLVDLGWKLRAIDHAVNRRLFRVHSGVYAVSRPGLSRKGAWLASVLACGEGAALSHESAALLYELFEGDDGDRPHVSVPSPRNPKHPGIWIHRRTPMPPVLEYEGVPVVDAWRVLLDLAPRRSPAALDALVNQAERRGLVDVSELAAQLELLAGRRGVRRLRGVLAAHQRTDSGLERRFLRLVAKAGLPRPETQFELLDFRVDFFWPSLGLVAEADGFMWHRTPAQQARDRKRDQALTAAGMICVRFTEDEIKHQGDHVVATLRQIQRRLSC